MFLSVREIRHSPLRTALIVAIIALVAWLVFLLSGLANGLSTDNGASIEKMNAQGLVMQQGVRLFLHRSILPMSIVQQIAAVPGVTAATPLGHLTVTVTDNKQGTRIDATVLAIDPHGFLAPRITSGAALAGAPAGGVVVDDEFKQNGVSLGDQLHVTPSGQSMTIAGFTSGQTYNHLPVIFMPIAQWQALKFATPAEAGGLTDPISAVAIQGQAGALQRVAAVVPNVDVGSRQTVIQSLPGYSSEMGTVSTILGFLFVIATLVIAVFFYVITLQKTYQFGVLKATGAHTRTLALDLMGQVTLLTLVAAAVGALLANITASLIPPEVPFALSNGTVVIYGIVLILVSGVAALLSAVRIARIDPLIAIGRVE